MNQNESVDELNNKIFIYTIINADICLFSIFCSWNSDRR